MKQIVYAKIMDETVMVTHLILNTKKEGRVYMSLKIMTDVDLNQNAVRNIPDIIETVSGKRMHALDAEMSSESENPVQNKAIKAALEALDAKIAEKSVNVDGCSVMKGTVNNKEVLHAVGYRNIVNNVEKGESFNVSFNGGAPPAGSLTATGLQSHAEGKTTTASGDYSHAEGYSSATTGTASHAEGYTTVASGNYSHAEGNTTIASGNYSHAEGHQVTAYGEASHAEGYGEGVYQSSMGTNAETLYDMAGSVHFSLALTECSHVEGKSTAALGSQSHAEGYGTRALGTYSHVEGYLTSVSNSLANGSHAEGCNTDVYGISAHAEGYYTRAVGNYSHAEGSGLNNIPAKYISNQGISQVVQMWAGGADLNVAYGNDSHSEGNSCCATGDQSHAEGHESLAYGKDSHAEGYQCIAYGNHSHAEGSCSSKYNFVYNGIDDDIIIPYFTEHHSFSMAKGNSSHVEGMNNLAVSDYSHAEGYCNMAKGAYTHVEGYENSTMADYSHAEGSSNKIDASAGHSHVEGDANKLLSGAWRSHAEGYQNKASGNVSHVEGYQNTVSGSYAHAEGYQTEASGAGSHTEGTTNKVLGSYSHVEGGYNISRGQYTHVEGYGNKILSEISGDDPVIAGAHISGAFNYIAGGAIESKGGMFITGSLNHTNYYGAYAGFTAGQGNFICNSAFAIGRCLAAQSCCGSVGNWNRLSGFENIDVKMRYSTEEYGRHQVTVKKHTDGTIIRLIVVLDGLKENNEIIRDDITSVKVNDVPVRPIYFSIAVDPLGCENYGPIGTYYLLIEADGFAPDPDGKYIVDFEYNTTELGDKNIFTVGNGLYAADEDCDPMHNANALAVTYDGTTKVQNDITFKYVDGDNQKHRISLQKIVTALIGLGVNLSDLELLTEFDM